MPPTDPTRLTGHCACCGAPTRSLFAMGHDARFRGHLSRALASAGWTATVDWFADETSSQPVSVDDALDRIVALIRRDWREKVELSASRQRPVARRAAPVGPVSPPEDSDEAFARFAPRDVAAERIERLMDALDNRPRTGQWGWYRPDPQTLSKGLPARYPARVQATRRDAEESSLIDLFVPTALSERLATSPVIERVEPSRWLRDEDARTA